MLVVAFSSKPLLVYDELTVLNRLKSFLKSELNTILASGEICSVHHGKTIDAAIKNIDKRAKADKSM
jgi:hypothetical protein